MSVTLPEARTHLNVRDDGAEDEMLGLYVDAANEWIAARVTDTTPDSIVTLATLLLLQWWWRNQLGPAGTSRAGDEYAAGDGTDYSIPAEVVQLLDAFPAATPTPSGDFPDAVAWPDPVEWPA